MTRLQIHPNRRFLQREDGSPFFYLADTAWELFHRLSFEEADFYLRRRKAQGFSVVQAVAIGELEGTGVPNANGDLPLHELNPARPNDGYFDHVDRVVRWANELGLVVALLPTWGDKVNRVWGGGPEIFDEASARAYGAYLRERFRDADLMWVLGGDRPVESDRGRDVWRAMAEGLGDDHLRTFHPNGGRSSSEWLHDESWLDFNMIQSGHHERNLNNGAMIDHDYALLPTKPCMEAEPAYEDHPVNWNPEREGWFSDVEVRRPAYWSVFAGGHGVTYGCHDVWQMWQPGREPIARARMPWREALDLPVAGQMRHLKALMLSRPFFERVPDQSLILSGDRLRATRDREGSYAFVYFPWQQTAEVEFSGPHWAWWFNPRTGKAHETATGRDHTPPSADDWVLVLDDLASGYRAPGEA